MKSIVLDKYQKKVIKNNSKNTLVIAGAGSGKTLTIVYKIKDLISKNLDPKEILCITFTKAAAQSLKEKLAQENIDLNVKTFHSLGYEIIRKSENTNLVKDFVLEDIIINHLSKCPKLYLLTSASFIDLGKGQSQKLKNNIIQNSSYFTELKEIIRTFINLFKSNNHHLSDIDKFLKDNEANHFYQKKERHRYFLKLVKKIINDYTYYLEKTNQIDFHDMINKATDIVSKEGIHPYKYIIIDEYQDTSLNKCLLIKAIQNQTGANLLAVGDDWQSIYRFTGSNLAIFTNFKKYFPKAKIIKLKNTYRNSAELLDVARTFILKNPGQIRKKLLSSKHQKTPIHIYYYNGNLKQVWTSLASKTKENTFVLGRNNRDIDKIPFLNKNMHYLTVHKSKGLEADKVIIVNLENSITGFPNKIKDSEYFKYVIPPADDYIFAEERRLFYVAITRTKNEVILLVDKKNPSLFVTEILKDSSPYIKIENSS